MDKPVLLIGLGISACALIITYNAGLATQNISHAQRINELNSEIKKRDKIITQKKQDIQNHKSFISRKDTAFRRFVDEYFKGEKR